MQVNDYPVWWENTLTIYNKHIDASKKVTWYRSVVNNCFWKHTASAALLSNSIMSYHTIRFDDNAVICRIPKDDNFLPKKDWDNSDHTKFTLAPGDIVVNGIADFEIDEYTAGKRSTDFLQARKTDGDAITISTVEINVGTGKGCEHYRIVGE